MPTNDLQLQKTKLQKVKSEGNRNDDDECRKVEMEGNDGAGGGATMMMEKDSEHQSSIQSISK